MRTIRIDYGKDKYLLFNYDGESIESVILILHKAIQRLEYELQSEEIKRKEDTRFYNLNYYGFKDPVKGS